MNNSRPFAALFALGLATALLNACGGASTSIPARSGVSSVRFSSVSNAGRASTGSANWLQFGKTAAHVGFNSLEKTLGVGNVAGLTTLWTLPTGAQITDPIVVSKGVAYVNSGDGYLYALNATSGSLIWKYQTYEGSSPQNMPAMSGANIVLPCLLQGNNQKNAMCAVDTTSGKRVWAYYVDCNCLPGAGVGSAPVVSGSYVAFIYANGGTDADYLLVANASNGKGIWSTGLAHGPNFSTAAIANGAIYFDITGSEVCSASLSSGAQNWCSPTGSDAVPSVSNGVVYANTFSNGIYAFNASTGAQLWQYTPSAGNGGGNYDPAAVANGRVYISGIGFSGDLYALNAKTGAAVYNTSGDGTATTSSASVANGVVYAGCGNNVCAFEAANGKLLYEAGGGSSQYVTPTVLNGIVYGTCGPNSACAYGLPAR